MERLDSSVTTLSSQTLADSSVVNETQSVTSVDLSGISAAETNTETTPTTQTANMCKACPSSASELDEEAYAYQIFMRFGMRECIPFATALADPASGYNPCLVPLAKSFLADPAAWHAKYR